MISDVLHDAVDAIDRYLNLEDSRYSGDLRARIVGLRDQMDALRRELDTPPAAEEEA